jgi:hypothetical protein
MSLENAIERIEDAFPPGVLDAQRVWGAAGTSYVDAAGFTEGIYGKNWRDLSQEFLTQFHDAIDYVDPARLQDFIPAYVRAVLRAPNDVSGLALFVLQALTRSTDGARFDSQFEALDESKKQAIAQALLELERVHEGRPRAAAVAGALDSYWRQHAPKNQEG